MPFKAVIELRVQNEFLIAYRLFDAEKRLNSNIIPGEILRSVHDFQSLGENLRLAL
jgi:hypothetical protein